MKSQKVIYLLLLLACSNPMNNVDTKANLIQLLPKTTWSYLIQEWGDIGYFSNRTKLITLDSLNNKNDTTYFYTKEIDTGFQLGTGNKKDTTYYNYAKIQGINYSIDSLGKLNAARMFFKDSLFNFNKLKTVSINLNSYHYILKDSSYSDNSFSANNYQYRLLYVEKYGLIDSTYSESFIAGNVHSSGKSIKLIEFNSIPIDTTTLYNLK
jgi:hypothetical protein